MATCMKVAEPIGLGAGKSCWHIFQAMCDFVELPRVIGATGISICAYLADGALSGPLRKHMDARHALYYSQEHGFFHGDMHVELRAMDWSVSIKCVAHGCSNSVIWGLHPLRLVAHRDGVHIGIASLINGRTALHAKVSELLTRHMQFAAVRSGTEAEIRAFWYALQVEPEMVDTLTSLDLRWTGEVLLAHASWELQSNALEVVSGCVMYLLRWVSFSETRWAKVGTCGRLWIRSLAIGLASLHRLAMEDGNVSHYHLSGYSKLNLPARRLLAVAAFAPLAAESTLLALFEDDRLLRRAEELWDCAASEV